MIFSPGLCGHFARGTLSKTYLKDSVFEINVQDQNIVKNPTMSKLTPKSKIVSELDIILSQLRHFGVC